MRSKLMILSILTFSALSHAGVPDFNSVLAENEKIQKELTQKLQKQLETKDLGKKENPDFHKVGAEIIGLYTEILQGIRIRHRQGDVCVGIVVSRSIQAVVDHVGTCAVRSVARLHDSPV